MEMLYGITPMLVKGGIALVTGDLLALAIKHKRKLKQDENKKASAQLEDYKELKSLLGNDGLILSENVRYKAQFDYEHFGVVAPTGTGKTTRIFVPNLLDEEIKGSLIILDLKGELYDLTSNFQQNICHRKVIKFSPLEPNQSEQYNMLEQCEDSTEVCQLATSLLMNGILSLELSTGKKGGGIEWIQMGEPLLSAALLYVKRLPAPYNTIENALKLIINTKDIDLDLLFTKSNNEEVMAQYNIYKTVAQSNNTAGSIKVTLASNLKLFTDPKINLTGSNTTFTAKELRDQPTAIYITFPERKSNYLAPFIAPFISQLLDKILDSYSYKSEPVHFLMDEFCNIGMINNMALHTSTVRSRKVSFMLCMQSISQLYQIYGQKNGDTILNNLKCKIFLNSISDLETLRYAKNLGGLTEIKTMNKTENEKGEVSFSYSSQTRNVINEDEIRRLKDNQCLIIAANKQPILDVQQPYFENDFYNERIKEPDKVILKLPNQRNKKSFDTFIRERLNEIYKDIKKELDAAKTKSQEKEASKEMNDFFSDIYGGK